MPYLGKRVLVMSVPSTYNKADIIGFYGTVTKVYENGRNNIGVRVDGKLNEASTYGVYWLSRNQVEIQEDEEMVGFGKVAIVNLLEDYSKKDYAFALYESEYGLLKYNEVSGKGKMPMVVVNPRGKDNRVLGVVTKILDTEEYGKGVTAQVIGVVNTVGYDARVAEEERLKEVAKRKAEIEKQLRKEIEKINNIELYEKMAKEHPENEKLVALVAELKCLV
jgi:uncharacterized protein YktA (UPF0223 family)